MHYTTDSADNEICAPKTGTRSDAGETGRGGARERVRERVGYRGTAVPSATGRSAAVVDGARASSAPTGTYTVGTY